MHGIVSGRYMAPLAGLLAAAGPVWVPDLPGFGRSCRAGGGLGVGELSDCLEAWMTSVDLDRPVVVGHSFGCQVVLALATRHPHRLRAGVLIGPTGDPRAGSVARQLGRWMRCVPREPLSFQRVLLAELADCGIMKPLQTFRRGLHDSVETRLGRVAVPLLLARGVHDHIAPQRWVDRLAGLAPPAQVVTVPGASHTVNYSHPAQVSRIITAFVDEIIAADGLAMARG